MAKLAYLEKEIQRLKEIKKGIVANSADWASNPTAAADIQSVIDSMEASDSAITAAEVTLKQKRNESKIIAKNGTDAADQAKLIVQGKYPANTDKWLEYGLKVEGPSSARPVPEKGNIKSIVDDFDGVGFIIETAALENADTYEYERGQGPANDTNTIPAFGHLRSVRKAKIVDDDVEQGIRYFYRYRGVNSKGDGEWSAIVSRVQ